MSIEARFEVDFPGFRLDVDLRLPARGITGLFGPSGSGKTTLLRCIAGLERAPRGRLVVNGETWQDTNDFLPVHRRPLGYVFQEARLFPHLSVRGNLDYGRRRAAGAMDTGALEHAVELLGIGHLLERMPERLSGGERQRVAVARALALKPRLLLMDEPLAALDAKRKQEVLPYLERLHDELAIPLLYVTHAADELARLADHMVVLENGRALASDPLAEVVSRLDLPLAHTMDAGAVVTATVLGHEAADYLTRVAVGDSELLLPRTDLAPGRSVRLRIHAHDVSLTLARPQDTSILNILPVTVTGWHEETPGQVLVRLDLEGTPLLARVSRRSVRTLALAIGKRVFAQVKGVALAR